MDRGGGLSSLPEWPRICFSPSVAKFEYIEWLMVWLLELQKPEFEWDNGNGTKNLIKHGVSLHEVEEVFDVGMALPLGVQVRPLVGEPRFAVTGPTFTNRVLTIAFAIRHGRIRTISARPANKKERKTYEKTLCEKASGI